MFRLLYVELYNATNTQRGYFCVILTVLAMFTGQKQRCAGSIFSGMYSNDWRDQYHIVGFSKKQACYVSFYPLFYRPATPVAAVLLPPLLFFDLLWLSDVGLFNSATQF